MKIVLASASPRRRELLSALGVDYTVLVSGVEEKVTESEPYRVVEQLSAQKAGDVLQRLLAAAGEEMVPQTVAVRGKMDSQAALMQNPEDRIWDGEEDLLVIGADTIVAVNGQILGKPTSLKDAAEMLGRLSGRAHQVYTGVTLYHRSQGKTRQRTFHECTQV